MRALRLAVVSLIAASIAHAQGGSGPSSPVDPQIAAVIATQRDALGRECKLEAVVAAGDLRYLACGSAGAWIVRLQAGLPAAVLERRNVDGDVTGFFVQDGELWMRITSVKAQRLVAVGGAVQVSQVPPAAPPPPGAPAPAPAPAAPLLPPPTSVAPGGQLIDHERPARDADVVEIGAGHVVVDMGSANGIHDGQHIAFYRRVREDVATGVATEREDLIAIGNVQGVGLERARVVLGLNERVPRDAIARATDKPVTASWVAPPRASDLWEISFLARPFLVLDNLGAGVFADIRAGYRPSFPMHFEALIMPVAIASAEQGASTPAAAVLAASYDSRLFEVGLGIGGQTVNDPSFDLEPGTGLTALQRVRIGARDGLHLEVLSYVALFHSEFEFSSLRVYGQVPVGRGSWLIASGGGGSLGIAHGELGLRILLSGNGDHDSFFLTTTIGGINVTERAPCIDPFSECGDSIDYAGPMVGVGGEWRL